MRDAVVIRPAFADALAPELSWLASQGIDTIRLDPVDDGELSIALTTRPYDGYTLFGSMPTVLYTEPLDGHPDQFVIAHDPLLCPGKQVSRIDYSNLDGVDELKATRAYIARLRAYTEGGPQQPYEFRVLDGFTVTVPSIGRSLGIELSSIPAEIIDTYAGKGDNTPPDGPGPSLMAAPCMFHFDFSGGMDAGWLWQVGHEADIISHPLDFTFGAVFGSRMASPQSKNAIIRAYLLWGLGNIYDYYGGFPWSRVLAGERLSQCALDMGYRWTTCYGAHWLKMENDMVDAVKVFPNVLHRLTALEQWRVSVDTAMSSLEPGGPVGQPAQPGGTGQSGITVTFAQYRVVASLTIFKDVRSQVQMRVDSGTAFFVYSETSPCLSDPSWKAAGGRDPYPNQLKELYVEWTDAAGKPHNKTFGQQDQVVLA